MKRHKLSKYIEIAGWVGGFAAALALDYWLLPRVVFNHGGRPLAALIGLLFGVILMSIVVEASYRLAEALQVTDKFRLPKTSAEKIPFRFRVMIACVAGILSLSMVFNGVDGITALMRAFR